MESLKEQNLHKVEDKIQEMKNLVRQLQDRIIEQSNQHQVYRTDTEKQIEEL